MVWSGKVQRVASTENAARAGLLEPALLFAAILLAWETGSRFGLVAPYILPAPARIAATLVGRFDVIWPEALVTAGEIIGGFVLGSLCGIAMALLMASSQQLSQRFSCARPIVPACPLTAIPTLRSTAIRSRNLKPTPNAASSMPNRQPPPAPKWPAAC